MDIALIIDGFARRLGPEHFVELSEGDAPSFLMADAPDEYGYRNGRIAGKDCRAWIDQISGKLPAPFPPSFYSLVSRYAFTAFEYGSVRFFANTGERVYHELADMIFSDEHLYPTLFANGLIEFGKAGDSYDPICFDTRRGVSECPIIRVDHEMVLMHEKIRVLGEIAPSFLEFIGR